MRLVQSTVDLWTAGDAGSRLTAQARFPMDKPWTTLCVAHRLPTGRRLPTSSTALKRLHLFLNPENQNQTPGTSFSLFHPGGCPSYRDHPTLPLTGPSLLALRPFRNAQEGADATMAALQGVHLASRPDLWQAYASAVPVVLHAARPVAALKARFAAQSDAIDALIRAAGHDPQTVLYLPLVARKSYWTVLIDPRTAQPLAFMPLDSF